MKQRGFSLISAIFLIVVLAALGAFAVRTGLGQQHTVNLAVLGSRALHAARTGIEWGAWSALKDSNCASSTLNLSEGALAGFTVRVTCVATIHTESGGPVAIYEIASFAQWGAFGTPDYASRRVRARFTNAP